MTSFVCQQCGQEAPRSQVQTCSGCEQDFCAGCFEQFEACERCDRVFCQACAPSFIQFPSALTICNDCYAAHIEDTDFLFE